MQLLDVNVLIYAHREDAPEHRRYAAWLRALTEADEPFALSEVVLAGFLRIVTNARIFDPPTPMETATAFCQHLVDWPRAVLIAPSRQHWDIFVRLCRDIQGPLVSDAYLAVLAIEHACELVTTDDGARSAKTSSCPGGSLVRSSGGRYVDWRRSGPGWSSRFFLEFGRVRGAL